MWKANHHLIYQLASSCRLVKPRTTFSLQSELRAEAVTRDWKSNSTSIETGLQIIRIIVFLQRCKYWIYSPLKEPDKGDDHLQQQKTMEYSCLHLWRSKEGINFSLLLTEKEQQISKWQNIQADSASNSEISFRDKNKCWYFIWKEVQTKNNIDCNLLFLLQVSSHLFVGVWRFRL